MAVLSDYTDGTITVTNGSVDFTGTDTLWRSAAFREGDTVLLQGFTGVIAGTSDDDPLILSNTTGQFTEPWPGASGTFSYRMRYQPDNARFSAKSTTLINLLANGILRGIADIGVENGKLLIGNVAGLYDLIDKTELGIQDPNGSLGKLAALTLAANKALTTDSSGNAEQIDLGTLGRAVLSLEAGTTNEYIRGDGTRQALNSLPFDMEIKKFAPNFKFSSAGGTNSYDINANISDSVDGGVNIKRNGTNIVNFGVGSVPLTVYGAAEVRTFLTVGGSNNARIYINNSSNTRVAEIGPGAGTGDNNRIGFINSAGGAWYFAGNANFTGTISKGGGTFLIDHPLDPFNRNLRHGFVEAPRYDLIYRGTVQLENGRATVDIDAASNMTSGTFTALTTNAVVTSLQNQDGFARLKPGPIGGGSFEIICEDETCNDLVSWVVIAERNDPFVKSDLDQNTDGDGRFVPEFEKEAA